jgi:hypothetical protein
LRQQRAKRQPATNHTEHTGEERELIVVVHPKVAGGATYIHSLVAQNPKTRKYKKCTIKVVY